MVCIIMKNYLYYIYWLYRTWPMRWRFPKYTILSFEDTVNEIIRTKKSISRFGDGEFRLLTKERGIYFQKLDHKIAERLNEVLSSNLPNHLVCIPSSFISRKNLKREVKVHWLNFINQKGKEIAATTNPNKKYGDALISRFYMDYRNKNDVPVKIKLLKQIWEDKDVLFIEGELSRLGVGNDFFSNARSVQRILCPVTNAFKKYEEVMHYAKKYGQGKLIIIALGPTATILAHDLAKEGYWALDLGHIDIEYAWYVQNAKSKVPVRGKKSAEVSEGELFDLTVIEEELYKASIIHQIV